MSKPVIEALLGRGAKSKVVQWLYLQDRRSEPIAARSLAREAEVAYGSINKTLQELVDQQLVVREETTQGPRYRAPQEAPSDRPVPADSTAPSSRSSSGL